MFRAPEGEYFKQPHYGLGKGAYLCLLSDFQTFWHRSAVKGLCALIRTHKHKLETTPVLSLLTPTIPDVMQMLGSTVRLPPSVIFSIQKALVL